MNTRPSPAPSVSDGRAGTSGGTRPVPVEEAEAALVEHYPRLVRLAYLALPAGLGRHRGVLVAHRIVQRALPRSVRSAPADGRAYALLRQEVLRSALHFGRRGALRASLEAVRPPYALGLRLHPGIGDDDELALERALSGLSPEARAAFALSVAEQLEAAPARALLERTGAVDPRGALRDAARAADGRPAAELRQLLEGAGFDAATVQARPTDLLRRRQRTRVALGVVAAVAAGGLLAPALAGGSSAESYTAAGGPIAAGEPHRLDPAALVRSAPDGWTRTARMDFTAWPARGGRTGDTALLGRALAAWAAPGPSVDVTSTPGTPRTGPAQPPQLLFAGDVADATVVLFYDGLRLVRFAQPRQGGGRAALDLAQVPSADLTTAAAVVLARVDGNALFLTAPWVAEAQTRDLMLPDRPAAPLHRTADGVTDPVPAPRGGPTAGAAAGSGAAGAACGTHWPVLQLRSSSRIAEKHSFLVTDLGDLAPVHLTFTPPPAAGSAARQPREATGAQALTGWAHSACRLGALRGQGVRAVNDWEFAGTALPEGGGRAAWTCDRADTWRGPGQATVQFVPPGSGTAEPGVVAGQQSDGPACSRFGQQVMAGVMWKSPAGHWYLLAAGSRDVSRITASHGVDARSDGPYLAVRAPRGTRPTLTGQSAAGGTLSPLGNG